MLETCCRETLVQIQFQQALGDARFTTVFSRTHPISVLRSEMNRQGLKTAENLPTIDNGAVVRVSGMTIAVNTPPTRNGKRAMFVTVEDETGLIDISVFGHLQNSAARSIMTSRLLGVEGVLQRAGPDGLAVSVNAERILWPWTGSLIQILEREKRVNSEHRKSPGKMAQNRI